MTTNDNRQRAFRALTHAVIVSIFGEVPSDVRTHDIRSGDVEELDGGIVQKGLDMVMLGHRPDLGLESLQRSGFLGQLLPDVQAIVGFGGHEEGHKDLWEHTKRVVRNAPPKLEVRWAALFHDVGKPRAFRKKAGKVTFHGHELLSVASFQRTCQGTVLFPDHGFRERVSSMIEALGLIEAYRSEWTDSAVRRARRRVEDPGAWSDLLDLARSDCTSAHADRRSAARTRTDELEARAAELTRLDDEAQRLRPPKGTGNVIAERLGLSGPRLGKAMRVLENAIRTGFMRPGLSPDAYVDWLEQVDIDQAQV